MLAVFLFILCAIGEFHVSVPYVLEAVWLLTGFKLGAGTLSPLDFMGLWMASLAGREVGAIGLYRLGGSGANWLTRFYRKLRLDRLVASMSKRSRVTKNLNIYSPFSVAYGRLFGLRVPITLVLGVKRRLSPLLWGVLLSSVVWDAVYIALGAIFGSTLSVAPGYLFLGSLGGLTLIYLITIIIRCVRNWFKTTGDAVPDRTSQRHELRAG